MSEISDPTLDDLLESDRQSALYFRDFLNDDEGIALIECRVDHEQLRPDRVWITGWLTISDCSRNITLEFNGSSPEGLERSNKKIDKLITTLCRLRGALNAG